MARPRRVETLREEDVVEGILPVRERAKAIDPELEKKDIAELHRMGHSWPCDVEVPREARRRWQQREQARP